MAIRCEQVRCHLLRILLLVTASLYSSEADLAGDIAKLLEDTAQAFQRHWHFVPRDDPLLQIGLEDVEAWLDSGDKVRADDVELFAVPPKKQAGRGGDFHSAPEPMPISGRLEKVRKAFGDGRALVINSLHRWCPKAGNFADLLFKQIGLPVDVYMYLTPPYSHSYGLHTDVMDAFMVQLVGSKHWTVCDGANCTDVTTTPGDILYIPMGTKHSAWTTSELSAHLTVNVERQFYVWGSILQALVSRLLVPSMSSQLDRLTNMAHFGMEGENEFSVFVGKLGSVVPSILQMPQALLNHTRYSSPFRGESLEVEWFDLINALNDTSQLPLWRQSVVVGSRKFKPAFSIFEELKQVDSAASASSLKWIAKLLRGSVKQMQKERNQGMPSPVALHSPNRGPQKLGAIAAARARKFQEKRQKGKEL